MERELDLPPEVRSEEERLRHLRPLSFREGPAGVDEESLEAGAER
jgi:hypothetical protein